MTGKQGVEERIITSSGIEFGLLGTKESTMFVILILPKQSGGLRLKYRKHKF